MVPGFYVEVNMHSKFNAGWAKTHRKPVDEATALSWCDKLAAHATGKNEYRVIKVEVVHGSQQ